MKRFLFLLCLLTVAGCTGLRYRHSVLEYTPLPDAHSRSYWEARLQHVTDGLPLDEVVKWLPGVLYTETSEGVTLAVLDKRWQVTYQHRDNRLVGRPTLASRGAVKK